MEENNKSLKHLRIENAKSTQFIIPQEIGVMNEKKCIEKGEIILKENDFFNDLDYIMSNDNFRLFYDKYFKDFSDVKVVLLYMKLYETIQKEYFEINNKEIEKESLAYIIKELMSDNFTRKIIMRSFIEYEKNNNPKNKRFILDIFNKKNNIKQITNR